MPDLHDVLLSDVYTLLSEYPSNSVAHVASGLHTGRPTVESFIRKALRKGLKVKKLGEAKVASGSVVDGELLYRVGDGKELLLETVEDNSEEMQAQILKEEHDPTERKRWILLYDLWLP
jgi:hypothetical protein